MFANQMKPLFKAPLNRKLHNGSAKLVVDIRESQQDILQDKQHPLLIMVLWQSEDLANFSCPLSKDEIHGVTLRGIHIGLQVLFELILILCGSQCISDCLYI